MSGEQATPGDDVSQHIREADPSTVRRSELDADAEVRLGATPTGLSDNSFQQTPGNEAGRPITEGGVEVTGVGDTVWVGSTQLSPSHPCFEHLKKQGLDLAAPKDYKRFAVNPSPLGGRRWYVSVSLAGRAGEFLVDTGASHSFISSKFYALMPGSREDFKTKVSACSADGSRMQTYGRAVIPFRIGGREYIASPTIADIADDGILGLDFAALYDAILNPSTGVLLIKHPYGEAQQCVLRQVSTVATVVQTVKIPPGQTCDVLIRSNGLGKGEEAVVEPDTAMLSGIGLVGADTLVGNASWTVVPVSNPGLETVYLKKNVVLGTVHSSEAVVSAVQSVGRTTPVRMELSSGLEKMISETDIKSPEQKMMLRELVERYQDAWQVEGEPLGRTDKVQHSINTGDAQPFKMPYRRLPLAKKRVVEEQVKTMLDQGVIIPSSSPWSSPVQMVTKKDGSIRFCIDYRKLNGVTKKNAYPLPRIDETLDSLGGNQWFCTLDLQSGYWQIAMKEEDKEKTAFTSHIGLYQFELMPFGLCNAPATFEAMMETLLSDLLWRKCLVYLDDVIVFGKTFEECALNLGEVLDRIRCNGLTLKPKKCELFRKSMVYLGRIISTDGVKADPDKLETVATWETPKGPKDIRSFLGFCSYYRDFIPGFSRVSQPLQKLSHWTPGKRKEMFPWGVDQMNAFKAIKALFKDTPVLRYPTEHGHFILDTDASNESIGAALSQMQEGIEVPLAFASNSMNKAQRNYCTTKRELLAVVVYTKKFRHFLYGGNFTLRTDHSALKWLLNFKEAEGMIGRWLNHLSEFGLENSHIQHRPGVKHINADCLSRRPIRKCVRTDCDDCGAHNAVVANVRLPYDGLLQNLLEWSSDTIREYQLTDPTIARLRDIVPTGVCPVRPELSLENREMRRFLAQFTELEMRDDLLCRWKTCPGKRRVLQIVIPTAMRRDILYYCHGHSTSGHFGKKRSLERLSRRYYWPGMSGDLLRWITTCPACCMGKPGPGLGKMPLQQELFGVRFARIAVDIISGVKTTPKGNTCMMVVSDYYTKYTRVYPLPDHTAVTCAEALVKGWVLHLGAPLLLHSDQGREFESRLWTEMCHQLAICKTRTNPYRPQSDGQVERFNRTLIQVLKPLVNTHMDDWDDQCEFVVHAYNNTVHSSTNCTPNLLVFGEDMIMPADLVFGVVGISPEAPCTVLFVESLRERFKYAYEVVRTHLQKAAKWQKVGYDTGLKRRRFEVGDRVIRLHEPLCNIKLAYNWDGPHTVVKCISQTTVLIQSEAGKVRTSNVARLRAWAGRDLSPVREMDKLQDEAEEEMAVPPVTPPSKVGKGVKKAGRMVPPLRSVKKVSAGEGERGRKTICKAKQVVKKEPPPTRLRCKDGKAVRRSPRLLGTGAVT